MHTDKNRILGLLAGTNSPPRPRCRYHENCSGSAQIYGRFFTAETRRAQRWLSFCSLRSSCLCGRFLRARSVCGSAAPCSFVGPAAAFTLIEMLVVIGIIALLAGLIIGLFPRFADLKVRARVKGELAQVETAINTYQSKRGFLPPDNPNNPGSNALYYELVGTIFDGAKYTTFTGDSALAKNDVSTAFGAGGF